MLIERVCERCGAPVPYGCTACEVCHHEETRPGTDDGERTIADGRLLRLPTPELVYDDEG